MSLLNRIGVFAVLAGAGGVAAAGTTGVNTTSPSDGMSVVRIMNQMLTGQTTTGNVSGSVSGSMSFGSGITATRLQDFLDPGPATSVGTSIGMGTGGVAGTTDQLWHDGTVVLQDRARYAGYTQNFGFRAGASGGSGFTTPASGNTFTVVPSGFTTGSNTITVGNSNNFRWMRANDSAGTNNVQTSLAADNGGIDQMIAFEVFNSNTGLRSYILAFEDIAGGGGDRDFNDLVMEVVVVPLPGGSAMGMAGLGLAGLGVHVVRRRKLVA